MNTYGLRSVNSSTFNQIYWGKFQLPRELRNAVVTGLRINNAVLNVLGYIPAVSLISGSLRIAIGLGIVATTLAVGNPDPNATKGIIIGHWYREALLTGITQIFRGTLEAFIPFGFLANFALDSVCTVSNLNKEITNYCGTPPSSPIKPHKDTKYPLPFCLLHIV